MTDFLLLGLEHFVMRLENNDDFNSMSNIGLNKIIIRINFEI